MSGASPVPMVRSSSQERSASAPATTTGTTNTTNTTTPVMMPPPSPTPQRPTKLRASRRQVAQAALAAAATTQNQRRNQHPNQSTSEDPHLDLEKRPGRKSKSPSRTKSDDEQNKKRSTKQRRRATTAGKRKEFRRSQSVTVATTAPETAPASNRRLTKSSKSSSSKTKKREGSVPPPSILPAAVLSQTTTSNPVLHLDATQNSGVSHTSAAASVQIEEEEFEKKKQEILHPQTKKKKKKRRKPKSSPVAPPPPAQFEVASEAAVKAEEEEEDRKSKMTRMNSLPLPSMADNHHKEETNATKKRESKSHRNILFSKKSKPKKLKKNKNETSAQHQQQQPLQEDASAEATTPALPLLEEAPNYENEDRIPQRRQQSQSPSRRRTSLNNILLSTASSTQNEVDEERIPKPRPKSRSPSRRRTSLNTILLSASSSKQTEEAEMIKNRRSKSRSPSRRRTSLNNILLSTASPKQTEEAERIARRRQASRSPSRRRPSLNTMTGGSGAEDDVGHRRTPTAQTTPTTRRMSLSDTNGSTGMHSSVAATTPNSSGTFWSGTSAQTAKMSGSRLPPFHRAAGSSGLATPVATPPPEDTITPNSTSSRKLTKAKSFTKTRKSLLGWAKKKMKSGKKDSTNKSGINSLGSFNHDVDQNPTKIKEEQQHHNDDDAVEDDVCPTRELDDDGDKRNVDPDKYAGATDQEDGVIFNSTLFFDTKPKKKIFDPFVALNDIKGQTATNEIDSDLELNSNLDVDDGSMNQSALGGGSGGVSSNDYSVGLNDSQELPPVGIVQGGGENGTTVDEDELSDIGDPAAELEEADARMMAPEIIDGVEYVYNPNLNDIVYDDRGHPGTVALIYIVCDIIEDSITNDPNNEDDDANNSSVGKMDHVQYSPKVYKVIKKKLRGRKFLVRATIPTSTATTTKHGRTSWREATKSENIHLLRDCFKEEKQRRLQRGRRRRNNNDDDDDDDDKHSEINSSLHSHLLDSSHHHAGIAKEGSSSLRSDRSPTMSSRPNRRLVRTKSDTDDDKVDDNNTNITDDDIRVTPTPLSRKVTPKFSNIHRPEQRQQQQIRKHEVDNDDCINVGEIDSDKPVQQLKKECQTAQDIIGPLSDFKYTMDRGIAAEEKLLSLIRLVDDKAHENKTRASTAVGSTSSATLTEPVKNELIELQILMKRMKYISIAPLFEHIERIEKITKNCLQPRINDHTNTANNNNSNTNTNNNKTNINSNNLDSPGMEREGDTYLMRMDSMTFDGSYETQKSKQDDTVDCKSATNHIGFKEDTTEILNQSTNQFDAEMDVITGKESLFETNIEEGTDDDSRSGGVENGHVLELEDSNDELSTMGESGIYTSESSLEDVEEFLDAKDYRHQNDDDDDNDEEDRRTLRSNDSNFSSDDDYTNASDEPIKRKSSIFEKPNPKSEQFFDRLNHFFEMRRIVEKQADAFDPSQKTLRIKVKAHSGGILKGKLGRYKKEYQQRDTDDHLVRCLDGLYDAANLAQTEFESFLRQLIADVGGFNISRDLILPPLKPRDRAFEKAKKEYTHRKPGPPESWMYDIVRASIVCQTTKQLNELNKWLSKNAHLVQAKNRFFNPVFNGYRDILYHISIPYRDGMAHVCELQVHHKDMYTLNEQNGMIKHYEFFRSCFSNPWRSQADTIADLFMMNKYGKIGGRLMKKLLKSEDPEQLRLYAGICRDKLDEFDRSLELYRRVLNLQEDTHGSEHEEMAATYLSIGLVLGSMGDTDESLLNLLKGLAIQESFLGTNHVDVADSYVIIGHMLAKRGAYSDAYTQYQRALMIRENQLSKGHFLVIKSLQDIGLVLQQKADYKESENEYRRALSIQEEVLGDGHPDLATTHALIGKTLCMYGDFDKSMIENKLALSIRETGLGKNHPMAAESHTALGVLFYYRGDYKSSQLHHQKALRIRESMLGKDDEECAISHGYLGEGLSRCGDFKGAVRALKRAQEIRQANVGMDNPITAGSYLDLGHIYSRNGNYEEALDQYRKAKVIRKSYLGQNHPDTALTYTCVGNALCLSEDVEAALTMHRKALVVFETVLGEKHPRTAIGYQSIADSMRANGKIEEALEHHQKALNIQSKLLTNEHPDTAESCSRIGDILFRDKEDLQGALSVYRQALTNTMGRCGKDHPDTAIALVNVGSVLLAIVRSSSSNVDDDDGFLNEAQTKLDTALKVLRGMGRKKFDVTTAGTVVDEVTTGRACVAMGTLLEMKEKINNHEDSSRSKDDEQKDIKDLYAEGVERLTKILGSEHPETQVARAQLDTYCTT